jgi:hypothetical protein
VPIPVETPSTWHCWVAQYGGMKASGPTPYASAVGIELDSDEDLDRWSGLVARVHGDLLWELNY